MQNVKRASATSSESGTVTKSVSAADALTWVSPAENEVFAITKEAELPEIVFEIRSSTAGNCKWSWTIEWEAKASGLQERARKGAVLQSFKESGSVDGIHKWTASFSGKVLGGRLSVTVSVGQKTLVRTVSIKGVNPTKEEVVTYVNTLEDMSGFEKLLEQETKCKHIIEVDGEPIVAFDKGYGIAQMTNPAPTYEQVWSWKENIKAGSSLYRDKVRVARRYLSQAGRTYTEDQLRHEVFSRWNGGSYHQWDVNSKAWVRKAAVLCDSNTGNIGWSTGLESNKEKTESELRERDKETYKKGKKGQSADHPWVYTGVCYADHVLAD